LPIRCHRIRSQREACPPLPGVKRVSTLQGMQRQALSLNVRERCARFFSHRWKRGVQLLARSATIGTTACTDVDGSGLRGSQGRRMCARCVANAGSCLKLRRESRM
jgi:hypothetical protein